jgi:hypothetical protein
VQVAAAGCVGKDKIVSIAELCVLTLQHRPHLVEAIQRQITAGKFGAALIALAAE